MNNTSNNQLVFTHIANNGIFCDDYDNLRKNNLIDFSKHRIAVLYAPNGVGKTSLARTLGRDAGSSFAARYNGVEYNDEKDSEPLFYVIADQNNRNIISGKAEEFILGENIRREAELAERIDNASKILLSSIKQTLKHYNITKKTNKIISYFEPALQDSVRELAKQGLRLSDIKAPISTVDEYPKEICQPELDSSMIERFINDVEDEDSILNCFLNLNLSSVTSPINVRQIGEDADAIRMLDKYASKAECVVCENPIDREKLIARRKKNRDAILNKLGDDIKKQIEIIENTPEPDDYIGIQKAIEQYFDTLDETHIKTCKKNIIALGKNISKVILAELKETIASSSVLDNIQRLEKLRSEMPRLTEEDELFIESVVEESMGKKMSIERDQNDKHIIVTIDGGEFIGKERKDLSLSAGEQNFLSLAFEMIRAKKSSAEIVVLDDPISSFDSIFKYKIVYSILSSLKDKKVILLTHSIDLVRLIQCQIGERFGLYIFNNHEGGENGFILVNNNEVKFLINLCELTLFLRGIYDNGAVVDTKNFLIAMVPFMRGYAHLVGSDVYGTLTGVMHGNGAKEVNVGKCYNTLFGGQEKNKQEYKRWEEIAMVSPNDIIELEFSASTPIVDQDKYPLLDRTLRNSIDYLRLRLLVEKNLINEFGLTPQKCVTTNDVINSAYPADGDIKCKTNRTKLMSKKSILNEFNHFEGNLNIFQPAIDISTQMLEKEKRQLEEFFKSEDWKRR